MFSAGLIALPSLLTKFDELADPSIVLDGFLYKRLHYLMLDEARRQMPLGPRARKALALIASACREFESTERRKPSDEDLAYITGLSVARIRELRFLNYAATPEELSDQIPQDLPDDHKPIADAVRACLKKLPPKIRRVMTLHYLKGWKQCDIAADMDVTDARVCQIHAEGLRLMRQLVRERLNDETKNCR